MVQAVQAPPKTAWEILPIVLRLHSVIRFTEVVWERELC